MVGRQADSVLSFLERCRLDPTQYHYCCTFAQGLHPGLPVRLASPQGYCSLTFLVGADLIIQFRPATYRLDLRLTDAARAVYVPFAPRTEYVGTVPTSGLLVYRMDKVGGVALRNLQEERRGRARSTDFRARLCKDFARFISLAWYHRPDPKTPLGKVGKSILPRLETLTTTLPPRFQLKAISILNQLPFITAIPWILSHGDIIAANIMVDPTSGALTGLIDWAEAEPLPFGVCLYGLEEILGDLMPTGFRYRPDAAQLRSVFWDELKDFIPDLRQESVLQAVKLARDLGVLLWYGIAFDDGAIDRVVQEGRDVGEIYRLDAFLDVKPGEKTQAKI